MRRILFYLLLLTFSLFACKSKDIQSNLNLEKRNYLRIDRKFNNNLGVGIDFKITNISNDKLVLYYPTRKHIQKKVEGKWINMKILDCPCDAPCKAPPDKMELESGEFITLNWNQKQSYCGTKKIAKFVRETIYINVEKGLFRLVVAYKVNNLEKKIYSEFKIK
jgi:hypothetical protein